ncbi:hypothetical protein LSCM1_02986 [Leishmania martiniquensis]|uniref:Uncharacterized protein n=1 Tax=Leishmania martiniquensis TaxID=1580590 RepID=A0A836KKK9_9TRYP|nr:hypothetical protein LSCM1_02986 [Leishmania martiniquensis]
MLRRQLVALSYQRGSWAPGSKHQKHMSMNPTMYLYRFAGPHGPGPYVMKYWWTLGCFPTGIERPFRLSEFLAEYKQHHVPIEVEEWLQCFVTNPYEELKEATSNLLKYLEEVPLRENTRGYHSIESGVSSFAAPLAKFEKQLNIRVPSLAVRAALGSPSLRERLKDELFEYNESLSACGSTPHRRMARSAFDEPPMLPGGTSDCGHREHLPEPISVPISEAVGLYASPSSSTSDDEKKLIRLLTTFSEGCALKEDYDSAFSLLASSLGFSHDDGTDAIVHSNAAAAAILSGRYKEAEFHGRQSALLEPQEAPSKKSGGRGYVLWATATACQEDFDRASRIIEKGLDVFPDNADLRAIRESLAATQLSASSASPLRNRMVRSKGQQARALLHGSGRSFDNEFDWTVFKNKLYPSKMNPSSNEMGSVFRRVGDFGGHISTSRSLEPL